MSYIKKKISPIHFYIERSKVFLILKNFALILIVPIFLYDYHLNISFNGCNASNYCVSGIAISTILLIFISVYFVSKNIITFFLAIFLSLFSIEYFLYFNLELVLKVLKSLLPFIFLLTFIYLKNNINLPNQFIDDVLNKSIPYLIIFIQFLIILSNFEFENYRHYFRPAHNEFQPSLILDYFKVYNYNQYFSFILVLVCGIRLFLNIKNKERIFHIFLIVFSCLHAWNFTALSCGLVIIFFATLNNIFSKYNHNDKNFRVISYFFIAMFVAIPFFSEFLLSYGIKNLAPAQLLTRLERYSFFFYNFEFFYLFNGIFPDPFFKSQMHSQFLEYFSFFGLFKALFLTLIPFIIFINIKKIQYMFPLSVIIGLGGGLNEIFTHLYTGQILFLYLVFTSEFSKRLRNLLSIKKI